MVVRGHQIMQVVSYDNDSFSFRYFVNDNQSLAAMTTFTPFAAT